MGRPLAATDRAGTNPNVVATLGRACALPLDMERWETMDDASLLVSTMWSAVVVNIWHISFQVFDFGICFLTLVFLPQVIQKCQVGMARSERTEARAAEWAAKNEKLQRTLEAKDGLLKEAASKNASLAAYLEWAQTELG